MGQRRLAPGGQAGLSGHERQHDPAETTCQNGCVPFSSAFSSERAGHTMQATVLVHSACIHLLQGEGVPGRNRGQFLAYLAKSMRSILVSYARSRGRLKRGAGRQREPLADKLEVAGAPNSDLIDLSEALERLALTDGRKADVVELKYFGGLRNRETADALGVSIATIERDWDVAKLWLLRELSKGNSNE